MDLMLVLAICAAPFLVFWLLVVFRGRESPTASDKATAKKKGDTQAVLGVAPAGPPPPPPSPPTPPPHGPSAAAWAAPPQVGSELGAYRLLELLGEGGMGVVFRARHRSEAFARKQGGDVALKVLLPQLAAREDIRERFEREAAMALDLDHPGIVRVFELVLDAGRLALAMELVSGRALSDVIGAVTGPIPWPRAWPMAEQLLDAVGYLHDKGVLHRDLKPENVMVTSEGQLKVLDFGTAKDTSSGTTKTGTGMGTVAYMAPEQYRDAKRVDARADIYALGMTLYEMLAGRLPWDSSETSDFEILTRKAQGDLPPPTDFYPDIPEGVVAAVTRSLAPSPDQRFATAGELKQALAASA